MHSTENWDQQGHGEQDPAPFLEPVDGCLQPRWYCTPWAKPSFAVRETNGRQCPAEA